MLAPHQCVAVIRGRLPVRRVDVCVTCTVLKGITVAQNKSTTKQFDEVSDGELAGAREGEVVGTLLAANDAHAGSGNGPAGMAARKAPGASDDENDAISSACDDDDEEAGAASVPALEIEEAFHLWVLTDVLGEEIARLRQRIASNLPNENEGELDKKLVKLREWLNFIEWCISGVLASTEAPGDWGVLEFADEALLGIARNRFEKLRQWRERLPDVAPVGLRPDGAKVSGEQTHAPEEEVRSATRRRADEMTHEILLVIKQAGISIGDIDTTFLWYLLLARAGKPGSCIYDKDENGLLLADEVTKGKYVTKNHIAKRLARLKKHIE